MKRLCVMAAAAAFIVCTGCQSTGIIHKEYNEKGELTKKVAVYRGSVATITETSGLKVDYQGVKAELDVYSNKGDVELVNAISAGVIGGMIAYGTGGASAVPAGVAAALSAARKKAAPATVDGEAPETGQAGPQAAGAEKTGKDCPGGTGAACELAKPPAGAVDPACYPQTPFVKQPEPAK
jgi:hypothetical protein